MSLVKCGPWSVKTCIRAAFDSSSAVHKLQAQAERLVAHQISRTGSSLSSTWGSGPDRFSARHQYLGFESSLGFS
jgi:hypothetical protein